MCQSMVNIQSPTAEIRRGKKRKKKKEERNYRMKILWSALLHRATINSVRAQMSQRENSKDHFGFESVSHLYMTSFDEHSIIV